MSLLSGWLFSKLASRLGNQIVAIKNKDSSQADAMKYDTSNKSLWTKFVQGLNSILNPGHSWYEYDSDMFADSGQGLFENIGNKYFGTGLTKSELDANELTLQNEHDVWQQRVSGMQDAGLNPAMLYGQGGASSSAPQVQQTQSGNMSDLLQILTIPLQMKLLKAQSKMYTDQGMSAVMNARANERAAKASEINAGANVRNAGTNERNAGINESKVNVERYNAETSRLRLDIERYEADTHRLNYENDVRYTDAQINYLSEAAAKLNVERGLLPKQLEIAEKNADSTAKMAIAAIRNADAAVQNAATNDRLSDYQTSLMYSQEMLNWYNSEGRQILNKYLPAEKQAEIDKVIKEGIFIDKRGMLVDKSGKLVDAQTAKTYVNIGTDILHSACEVAGVVSDFVAPTPNKIGF